MDTLSAFVNGFGLLGSFQVWLFIISGVLIGLIFGILPGVSAMTAMVILLPFIFNTGPEYALPLFMAITSTSMTGGAITSILLNIPGDSVNAATVLDGYPMTRKGEGDRALGAAFTSSAMGGGISIILALIMVPLIMPIMFAVNISDMFFIILMGLACIAALSEGSSIKGLLATGLGIILSFIGLHVLTGVLRFTGGTTYLIGGLPLVPVIMGMFALPEMIELASQSSSIVRADKVNLRMKGVWQGCKDALNNWGLIIRCTLIGYIIGIIPGVGGSSAIWISYGQAKQTSKRGHLFGTGVVEGVIAPECANHAENGGALLTTLALGIPGNVGMAVVLAALLLLGITPGPEMMKTHLPLTFTILEVFFIGSLLGAAICFVLAPKLAKIATIPVIYLVPITIAIVFIGAFAPEERFMDLVVLLIFTALSMVMREFGFSRPALVIGFVLGDMFEKYLAISLQRFGILFFARPISMVLIILTIYILFNKPMNNFVASLTKKRVAKS